MELSNRDPFRGVVNLKGCMVFLRSTTVLNISLDDTGLSRVIHFLIVTVLEQLAIKDVA